MKLPGKPKKRLTGLLLKRLQQTRPLRTRLRLIDWRQKKLKPTGWPPGKVLEPKHPAALLVERPLLVAQRPEGLLPEERLGARLVAKLLVG